MRFPTLRALTLTTLLIFGAASAQAATVTISGIPAQVAVDDTFTVTLTSDFTDFTSNNTIFQLNFSTFIDGAVLEIVDGVSADQIFGWEAAPGAFVSPLPLVPNFVPNNNLDIDTVRTGSWLAISAAGNTQGDWAPVLATITFQAVAEGTSELTPGFAGGDTFQTTAGVVADQVTFLGAGIVTVPEPGIAGLSLAALITLYGIRRTRRA